MLDVVKVDGKARGIIARNLVTGEIERHSAHAVVLASGGYGNVFYLSTNAMGSNVTASWRAHRRGAYFANPCYTQIHPTCIPVSGDHQSKLTLMSESLRNDGRIWVPKKKEDALAIREGRLKPTQLSEEDRDYYLERRYPAFGNLVPRDVASRAAKECGHLRRPLERPLKGSREEDRASDVDEIGVAREVMVVRSPVALEVISAGNTDDAGLRHREAFAVLLEVDADLGARGDGGPLVDDRAADDGAGLDHDAVHQDALLDVGVFAGVDTVPHDRAPDPGA